MPRLYIPNVSVEVDIKSIVGVKLNAKGGVGTLNFDVKVKLEEKERRSQMIVIDFGLLLTTKPGFVRFEIGGTATLKGKEDEIDKMLEPDPNTKAPLILNEIYQQAFIAMYTLSAILGAPPPPHELIPAVTKETTSETTTEETKSIEGTKLTSSS